MFNRNLPRLPEALQREIEAVYYSTEYDMSAGGQAVPRTPTVTTFRGCIMPVSDKDLRYAPEGTYTALSEKLYTNYALLEPGMEIRDPLNGQGYTVSVKLDHNVIHPLKRYVVERKGASTAQ